jgi:hypothetical protein
MPVSAQNESEPSLLRAMVRGSLGFAFVSLAGFAVWAFGGRWLYAHLGEAGLYFVCLVVFLGSSGLWLHPLVRGARSLVRFYGIFIPAFLSYALLWCAAWFALGFGAGEWVGSLAGSVAFVAVAGRRLGNYHGFVMGCVVLFLFHSAGYFLGGELMYWMTRPARAAMLGGLSKAQLSMMAKLAWGLLYGLGFGAGLGHVFYTFQRQGDDATRQD